MYAKLLLLGFAFIKIIGARGVAALNGNLSRFDCETICKVTQSDFQFDPKSKLCKCILPKNADDTDITLLTKKGNLIGKTAERISDRVVVIKRETNNENNKIDETHPVLAEQKLKTDVIVGQAAPSPSKKSTQLSRKVKARIISQEQQALILKQIRDRLSHLERAADMKTRQGDIDAIINLLRQLSNTALQPQTRSSTQPNLKLRTLMEDNKNKRKERREKILTLTHHSDRKKSDYQKSVSKTEKNEALREAAMKEIFPTNNHFEVITQDPKLVDG